jgi:hypothetical protein
MHAREAEHHLSHAGATEHHCALMLVLLVLISVGTARQLETVAAVEVRLHLGDEARVHGLLHHGRRPKRHLRVGLAGLEARYGHGVRHAGGEVTMNVSVATHLS